MPGRTRGGTDQKDMHFAPVKWAAWRRLLSQRRKRRSYAFFLALTIIVSYVRSTARISNFQAGPEITEIAESSYIDIISVGTMKKPEFQNAQERTFGSHPSVRNFFRLTELNDTDRACHTAVTVEEFQRAANCCKHGDGESYESALIRKKLKPFQSRYDFPGWMCAQKRPIDGLHLALERYQSAEPMPSYLIIMDDDTYVNMNLIVQILKASYSENDLHVLAGCILENPKELRFRFPFGGFGTILTRKAIENLVRPIYCDVADRDGFARMACWRLSQNHFGEQQFFREGMSVSDLLYTFSTEYPFSDVARWTNGTGFCFHSDHAIAYFFSYYHIAFPENRLMGAELSDKLRKDGVFGYVHIGIGDQCGNAKENCSPHDSMICHNTKPYQMDRLFAGVGNTTASR